MSRRPLSCAASLFRIVHMCVYAPQSVPGMNPGIYITQAVSPAANPSASPSAILPCRPPSPTAPFDCSALAWACGQLPACSVAWHQHFPSLWSFVGSLEWERHLLSPLQRLSLVGYYLSKDILFFSFREQYLPPSAPFLLSRCEPRIGL